MKWFYNVIFFRDKNFFYHDVELWNDGARREKRRKLCEIILASRNKHYSLLDVKETT